MTIDWRTVCMLLPQRRFTAQELQRAIPDPPSTSLKAAVALNVVIPAAMVGWVFGGRQGLLLGAVLLAFGLLAVAVLALAWRNPSHRLAHWTYYALPLVLGIGTGLAVRSVGGITADQVLACALVAVSYSLVHWFTVVYRHKYVEMRLQELDERERSAEMARQLAQAQIQPHFLFNSLASLQHWVHARDDRAAPMLDALLGFLRANLPLFDRRLLALAEEAQAVRHYLTVMQLRLGERLRWQVEVDDRAGAARLPPGLLLTLVENAIEHGVQPSLRGADVAVSATVSGERLTIEVRDTGPGPVPAAAPAAPTGAARGVGLTNARDRLAQAFGADATLTLAAADGGGCVARIDCPYQPAST